MIITLSIRLVSGMYAKADWGCELEIADSSSLHDLHDAIQAAVGFDNRHLYSFFISREESGAERLHFDGEEYSLDAGIGSVLPLPTGKKLFYWFDFGDDWIFQVLPSQQQPGEARPNRHYPFVVAETGSKPEQYKGYDPAAEAEW